MCVCIYINRLYTTRIPTVLEHEVRPGSYHQQHPPLASQSFGHAINYAVRMPPQNSSGSLVTSSYSLWSPLLHKRSNWQRRMTAVASEHVVGSSVNQRPLEEAGCRISCPLVLSRSFGLGYGGNRD